MRAQGGIKARACDKVHIRAHVFKLFDNRGDQRCQVSGHGGFFVATDLGQIKDTVDDMGQVVDRLNHPVAGDRGV